MSGFVSALIATNPDAVWPLDEITGTTAHDLLSGHHDATPTGSTPVWAADTSPLGTPAPSFTQNLNFTTAWQPTMGGDFTVATFGKAMLDGIQSLVHYNDPVGFHQGWQIGRGTLSSPLNVKYIVEIGDGSTTQVIPSDSANTAGVWYWLAFTRASGLFTFYINGAAQTTTYSGSYANVGGHEIVMGYATGTSATNYDVRLSYTSVWTTRALSASEIAGLYNTI